MSLSSQLLKVELTWLHSKVLLGCVHRWAWGGLGGVRPPLEDFAYVVNSDVRGGRYYIRPPPRAKTHAHVWSRVPGNRVFGPVPKRFLGSFFLGKNYV